MLNDIPALVLARHLRACVSSLDWLDDLGNVTPQQAWEQCTKSDYMIWLCLELNERRHGDLEKSAVLACCDMVDLALPMVHAKELATLVRNAVYASREWASGRRAGSRWAACGRVESYLDEDPGECPDVVLTKEERLVGVAAQCLSGREMHLTCERLRIARYEAARPSDAPKSKEAATAAADRLAQQCVDLVRKHVPWSFVQAALEKYIRDCKMTKTGAAPIRYIAGDK